ncbi:Uncharacterised protein [Klebsiella pneumoniae]|nr:Uncharacterised protein [Klebsiella pneumoniae]
MLSHSCTRAARENKGFKGIPPTAINSTLNASLFSTSHQREEAFTNIYRIGKAALFSLSCVIYFLLLTLIGHSLTNTLSVQLT